MTTITGKGALAAVAGSDRVPASQSPYGAAQQGYWTPDLLDTYISQTAKTLTNKTLASPTLTGPILGTPASGTLTNCTGLPNAGVVGLGSAALVATGTSGATIPLLNGANTWSGQNTFAAGTIATSQPFTITQTWNAGGVTFAGLQISITDTASQFTSLLSQFLVGATEVAQVSKQGAGYFTGIRCGSNDFQYYTTYAAASAGTTANRAILIGADASTGGIGMAANYVLGWSANNAGSGDCSTLDTIIRRAGAATIQLGAADVNGNAVAQTVQGQSGITGTDRNGGNVTIIAGKQTGAGTPGNIVLQVANQLGTGTTAGTPATGLTIQYGLLNMQPSVVCGNQALATTATDGFLYIPTCAGTPTGVPTAFTGRIAMIYDTTNDQFWFYRGGWKQPKTPAGAALVTWQ